MTQVTHQLLPDSRPKPAGGEVERAKAPRVPFALLLLALLVGSLVALLILNTASAANELKRHDAAVADSGLAAELEQLQNQVAASAAPQNLASAAALQGMVPAANPAFLRMNKDGSVTLLGSPAVVTAMAMPTPVAVPIRLPASAVPPRPSATVVTKSSAKSTASTAPVTRTASTAPGRRSGTTLAPVAAATTATPGGAR